MCDHLQEKFTPLMVFSRRSEECLGFVVQIHLAPVLSGPWRAFGMATVHVNQSLAEDKLYKYIRGCIFIMNKTSWKPVPS